MLALSDVLSDVLSDGKGGCIRGVRYHIRFNSIFEIWQKNYSFNILFNIALPKIKFKILFN